MNKLQPHKLHLKPLLRQLKEKPQTSPQIYWTWDSTKESKPAAQDATSDDAHEDTTEGHDCLWNHCDDHVAC